MRFSCNIESLNNEGVATICKFKRWLLIVIVGFNVRFENQGLCQFTCPVNLQIAVFELAKSCCAAGVGQTIPSRLHLVVSIYPEFKTESVGYHSLNGSQSFM